MRFPVFLGAACALTFSALAQAPDPAPSTPVETVTMAAFEPSREDAVLEAYIDGIVEAHRREHHTPGVTVSVVKDGRILFAKGYGVADATSGRLVSGQETLFRIGSVSKTFIWTAVMMLVDRGEIDLDADVNQYLKGMRIPDAFRAPITMNHLMAHRAGFEDTFGVFTVGDSSELSLTEALKAHMPKRVFAPGARTSYSNWGAALAAKIVEDVSGVSFEEFMQREILTPLAMTKTTLKGPSVMSGRLRKKMAAGHEFKGGASAITDYMEVGPYAPAGAISASASDMAAWMLFHLGEGEQDGVRLMSRATHQAMWRRAYDDRSFAADLAHGFFSKTYRGYEIYGHGGATAGFYSHMTLIPEMALGVFVSQNAGNDRTLVSELPDLIVDRLALAVRSISVVEAGDTQAVKAKDYEGAYLVNRRSFSQFEKLFSAGATAKIAAAADGALVVTAQGKAVRFEPLAGASDIFQDQYGNRIAFGRNGKGAVTHLTDRAGVHSLEKVGFFANPIALNIAFGAALLFGATAWIGAWRRQGREVTHGPMGFALNIFDLAAAATVFVFAVMLGVVFNALSNASAADLLAYPSASIIWLRMTAYGVFAFATLAVFSLAPAWISSGWSIWRKAHHTLFALAMAALGVMLAYWKVIFSATA